MTAYDAPAVLTSGLTKVYNGRTVLENINLEVPRGSVYALLGPNGAGKTTIIKILLNLIWPTAGKIKVLGLDGLAESIEVRRRVGYQAEIQRIYQRAVVGEIIGLCRSLYPVWNDERVTRYCKAFELPLEFRVGELSKGKMTLLALVLAIGPDPELILLDEPFSGLDPLRRRQVIQLLVEELAGEGRTIIISSHQIQDIERIADHVGFLIGGRLALSKPVEQLLGEEKKVQAVFAADPPEGMESWAGVRNIEREGRRALLTISGNLEEILDRLKSGGSSHIEVYGQSLEDIFVDYAGGVSIID
ncbi:MAG: ATP-binding cassette domain-containing protein [Bacillota bacterium]